MHFPGIWGIIKADLKAAEKGGLVPNIYTISVDNCLPQPVSAHQIGEKKQQLKCLGFLTDQLFSWLFTDALKKAFQCTPKWLRTMTKILFLAQQPTYFYRPNYYTVLLRNTSVVSSL